MRCSGCQYEAPADFAFCPKCGNKLKCACPSCGDTCPSDYAFCPKCGTPIAAPAMPSIRTPVVSKASSHSRGSEDGGPKPEAGVLTEQRRAVVEASTTVDERRPVTVLFADLSGFTTLSESRDPEEVAGLVDRCLRAMAEVIHHYEGTVDKYIGDCVMALFGAPVAHEDDPERAIRAALEMRDRVAEIDHDLRAEAEEGAAGPILSLHVGINTGLVIAGAVGSEQRRDYTVLGDAVNIASRLQSAAGVDEVVVGEQTYRLARHAVSFEPLGSLQLKGKSEPLLAYRVVGLPVARQSARGLEAHGLVAPLVGRAAELGQLLSAFDLVASGRMQVVSLVGEAGVGKSRLLGAFLDQLEATDRLSATRVTIRRANCSSLGERAYGMLAAFCRDLCAVAPGDPPATIQTALIDRLTALGMNPDAVSLASHLLGHVLGLDLEDVPLRHVEPEQLKRQLFLVVRNIFDLSLRLGPLVVVVEDVHWTDAASIELLRYLIDHLGERPLMFILTHRSTLDASQLIQGRSTYTSLRLAPLSPEESAALLDFFFGPSITRIPEHLRDLLISRASGNAFYLEEVIRGLIEDGVLVCDTEGWRCTAAEAVLDIPPSVQSVLLARLDRLPPGPRRFAQELAVFGPSFDEALLRRVCGERGVTEEFLDVLQAAEIIEEIQQPDAQVTLGRRYQFTRPLLQEVAYQSLLVRQRAALHGQIGSALEAICGDHPERLADLEALGYHFSLSAERTKGSHYLTAAGDWARGVYANEDAVRYYQRALDILGKSNQPPIQSERRSIHERLGDVLGLIGRRADALAHYTTVLTASAGSPDRPTQARLWRKIGTLRWDAGERERALADYQAGLALLDAEDGLDRGQAGQIELAHLYQEMGRLAFRSGENQQAVEWAERALALVQRLDPVDVRPGAGLDPGKDAARAIADAYNTLGVALARLGELEPAVAYIERSVAVTQEHNLPQVACRAYTNLGVLYSTLDPGRAIATCLDGLELAKKIGDLGFQSWLYANLAGAYCTFTGQCEAEGIAAAQKSIDLDRQLGQLDHLAVPLIVLGQIYQCHGETEPAFQCYLEALRLAEEMREPQLLFPCYDGLATLYLELGDQEQAERYMLLGQQICAESGLQADTLVVLPFLC